MNQNSMDLNKRKSGIKHDINKLKWNLLPLHLLNGTVKVLTQGEKKYGAYNWQLLSNPKERYFAASMRHLVSYQQGELSDPESGCSHLDHAIANLIFLKHFDEDSDRPEHRVPSLRAYEERNKSYTSKSTETKRDPNRPNEPYI